MSIYDDICYNYSKDYLIVSCRFLFILYYVMESVEMQHSYGEKEISQNFFFSNVFLNCIGIIKIIV